MHERVRDNARHILGAAAAETEVERLARQSWRNYLRYLREFVALESLHPAFLRNVFTEINGWEHIEETMREGRGAIIASAHFGNWDFAAGMMAMAYPIWVIADTFSPPRLDRLINSMRATVGVHIIPIERPLKRTIKALRGNQAVAFLVDKPVPGQGVKVQFFGRPVEIPSGAAFFSLKTGAPILPAFAWRNADNSFSARVFPPIRPQPSGDFQSDMQEAMQQIMGTVEEVVRERPENWYMFRRMWPEERAVA